MVIITKPNYVVQVALVASKLSRRGEFVIPEIWRPEVESDPMKAQKQERLQEPGKLCLSHLQAPLLCWPVIIISSGRQDKGPQTERLNKQEKWISLQFQRLEIADQGGGRVDFFWGLSPWLADGRLLPVCSHGLSSVHVCVLISSSYEDISHIGLGPPRWTYSNLVTSGRILSPKTVTFSGTGD